MEQQAKLQDNERASDMEKVILLCAEITFAANTLQSLCHTYSHALRGKNEADEILKSGYEDMKGKMSELALSLVEVREDLIDYMNGRDACAELDIALGSVVFHAINDLPQPEQP